jgi:cytochrome c biogenesis protein CcmG/thiol:disulfide interchange protein DsbE
VLAGWFAAAAPAGAGGVAAVGKPAPPFLIERLSGGELTMRAFAGRPLVINVFAWWCNNCHLEEPSLVKAYAKYRGQIAFLGIDEQEGVSRAKRFAAELHVPFEIALDDGQFAATYDTSKIPETIFIDAHGIVRAIDHGLIGSSVIDGELAKLAPGGPSR